MNVEREDIGEESAGNGGIPRSGGRIARGLEVIVEALRNLPAGPGVYRMLNKSGDAL